VFDDGRHDPRDREIWGEKFGALTVVGVSARRVEVLRGVVGAGAWRVAGACSTVVSGAYVGWGVYVRVGACSTVVSGVAVGGGGGGATGGPGGTSGTELGATTVGACSTTSIGGSAGAGLTVSA
jgi:hypothetical protein